MSCSATAVVQLAVSLCMPAHCVIQVRASHRQIKFVLRRQAHMLQASFTRQVALEILTPPQAAVLIVSMHPAQLDAPSLCDAVR